MDYHFIVAVVMVAYFLTTSQAKPCDIGEFSSNDVGKALSILKRSTQGCPKPPDPENGRSEVEFETFQVGDAVKYKCHPGYTMIGSATRHCQENGRWAGERPTCEMLCSFPVIRNKDGLKYTENPGKRDVLQDTSGNTVLTEIQFACEPGYSLIGSARIRCVSGGKWDSESPICVKGSSIHCPDPKTILNGNRKLDSRFMHYSIGSYVHFNCNDGYSLSGPPIIVCTSDGRWSSDGPSCVLSNDRLVTPRTGPATGPRPPIITVPGESVAHCKKPAMIKHGNYAFTLPSADSRTPLDQSIVEINTIIEYKCNYPYVLDGPSGASKRYCLDSGEWSGRQPICIPDCGKSVEPKSPQVVNGTRAKKHGFPWHVALTTYATNAEYRLIHCGGVVVHERWVLTAAHCLTKSKTAIPLDASIFLLFFGKHFVDRNVDDNDVKTRKAVRLYIHENYNPWSIDNDLGLIFLNEAVPFNEAIAPLCLPSVNSMVTFTEGETGVVSGWGVTDRNRSLPMTLMEVTLPIVSNQKCQQSYKDHRFKTTVTDNMYCAGYEEGGKSTCHGDSGGGMAFLKNGRYFLEGIVSWGSNDDCAAPGAYAGFTRVRNFIPWIKTLVPV